MELEQLQLEFHTMDELHEVAESPGVYVWYSRPNFGPADWKMTLNEGVDAGVENFKNALDRYTERNATLPYRVRASNSYFFELTGTLIDQSFAAKSSENEVSSECLASERIRGAAARVLQDAGPLFASPLYIGKAKSLRNRLLHHRTEFRSIHAALDKESDREGAIAKILSWKQSTFASRAVGGGYSEENLYVITLALSSLKYDEGEESLSRAELEKLAEFVEAYLNRWNRPKLGKR